MLRPYQSKAIEQVRLHYATESKKVLLKLATGGGKTVIFSQIMKTAAERGKRCIMAVRGRSLVEQASARLIREGITHGVHMAGHWNYYPPAKIQICSIDTLLARNLVPPGDLIVLDEAHYATSEGYRKFLRNYPNAFILAVTATPYVDKSLRHVADQIISPISFKELVEQGYLVDARYYAPVNLDLSGIKISQSTKDYAVEQLSDFMQQGALMADTVTNWKKFAQDRSTICFATSIGHSKNIVQQFLNNGIKAEHCDADTPDKERTNVLRRLESGETKVVSNVGILCVGVDLPFVGCITMARPTKSYNLFIQQAGRGTRPFAGKNDFILLDHAGNVLRHGFINEEPQANLDGKLPKPGGNPPKTCTQCFAVYIGFKCQCGFRNPVGERTRDLIEVDGTLGEISDLPFEAQFVREVERLKKERRSKGFKPGWVYYKLIEIYGADIVEQYYPRREVPAWVKKRGSLTTSE